MNANENMRTDANEDVVVLGSASTETHGGPFAGEEIGGVNPMGISDD
jgi:hypothetical protein